MGDWEFLTFPGQSNSQSFSVLGCQAATLVVWARGGIGIAPTTTTAGAFTRLNPDAWFCFSCHALQAMVANANLTLFLTLTVIPSAERKAYCDEIH